MIAVSSSLPSHNSKLIGNYSWFQKNRSWQREIKKLLANGFKMEVEAMISKDLTYLTEEYVPNETGRREAVA